MIAVRCHIVRPTGALDTAFRPSSIATRPVLEMADGVYNRVKITSPSMLRARQGWPA